MKINSSYQKFFITALIVSAMFIKTDVLKSAKPVVLEGLYATSVNLGYNKYGPHKLFDGKNDYWATMPGAGPDEGIMIYFQDKTMIKSMEIQTPGSGGISKISKVQVYANGVDCGTSSVNSQININKNLLSLYIRITDINGIKLKEVPSEINHFTKKQKSYSSNLSAGIKEIKLFGQGGVQLKVIPPRVISGQVKASSTLKPVEAYSIDYLFDSRKDSAWVEGSKKSGTGEYLKFHLKKSVTITRVKIWNGMLMSSKHYKSNERVKKFTFGIPGSEMSQYKIIDSMDPQVTTLKKPLKGKKFIFKIDDIYRGTFYKDCVITELRFYDGNNWFMINTGEAEKRKRKSLNRIKGTVMNRVLDKHIGVSYSGGDSQKSRSIILRSNNTFVIWIESEEGGYGSSSSRRLVIDGFWDIRSLSSNKAIVRIMGKKFKISETFEMYKGNQKEKRVSIFMDTLTIDNKSITGKKNLGKITY